MIKIQDILQNQVTSSYGARFSIDGNKFVNVHGQKEEEANTVANGQRASSATQANNSSGGNYLPPPQNV